MPATVIRGYPATEEQEKIIQAVKRGATSISVNAFAGTGKTSTLIGVTESIPYSEWKLYLAFNASMAKSAKSVFSKNINLEVKTVHAFAMPHILGRNEKIRGNYNASEIARMYAVTKKDAYTILRNFEWFCNSDALSIPSKMAHREKMEVFFEQMDNGSIDKTHSFYLKKFQLNLVNSVPMRLKRYALAMLDEYQDTNAVTRSIFDNLEARQRIVVGDTHQNIYGFRGSNNQMGSHDGDKYSLTHSFRFGSEIAECASKLLFDFKGETEKITGGGTTTVARTAITLSRTNSYLVQNVLAYIQKNVYYQSIRDPELIFGLPINIASLNEGKEVTSRQFTYLTWEKDKFDKQKKDGERRGEKETYKNFATYIMAMGQENDDAEMIWAGRIADEYPLKILEEALEQTHDNNRNPEPCQYFLGTAHSAKGLEFDIVKLNEDFRDFFEIIAIWALKNDVKPDDNGFLETFVNHVKGGLVESNVVEEFNLFYVAITRAKVKVYFDSSMRPVFDMSKGDMNRDIKIVYDRLNRRAEKESEEELAFAPSI